MSSHEKTPQIISRTGGFSGRVKQFGKRLVIGGKQFKGALRGLVHAKTPTKPVDTVPTTLAPTTGRLGGTKKISSPGESPFICFISIFELMSPKVVKLSIQNEPSDGQASTLSIKAEGAAGGDETPTQSKTLFHSLPRFAN
jgi:hypothetical protein